MRRLLFPDRAVARVLDEPDDLDRRRRARVVADPDAPADGVGALEVALREGFVDDRDPVRPSLRDRRRAVVAGVELAPGEQRNAHRPEVSGLTALSAAPALSPDGADSPRR